jgi:acetyl esterase/lipase
MDMGFEHRTLGELLSDPRITRIAPDAIRGRDLSREELWNMTLPQVKEAGFTGNIAAGLEKLYAAADTGEWYYPLYTEEECAEDEFRRGVNVVWLPSDNPEADQRPFILIAPGGGFVNVWSLTEGWPTAAQFNDLGYHVFVLTYQVGQTDGILDKNMEVFSRALRLIQANKEKFHLCDGSYITCGFSAGGYLVCLWNTPKGYASFGLPKPEASFPIYSPVSLKQRAYDPDRARRLYGDHADETARGAYETQEYAQGFPPCALFLAADDELVSPDHSRMLAKTLERLSVPCRLEIGPEGGHGFADGSDMCMAGWPERAVRWFESIRPEK